MKFIPCWTFCSLKSCTAFPKHTGLAHDKRTQLHMDTTVHHPCLRRYKAANWSWTAELSPLRSGLPHAITEPFPRMAANALPLPRISRTSLSWSRTTEPHIAPHHHRSISQASRKFSLPLSGMKLLYLLELMLDWRAVPTLGTPANKRPILQNGKGEPGALNLFDPLELMLDCRVVTTPCWITPSNNGIICKDGGKGTVCGLNLLYFHKLALNPWAVTTVCWIAPCNNRTICKDGSECTKRTLNLLDAPELILHCRAVSPILWNTPRHNVVASMTPQGKGSVICCQLRLKRNGGMAVMKFPSWMPSACNDSPRCTKGRPSAVTSFRKRRSKEFWARSFNSCTPEDCSTSKTSAWPLSKATLTIKYHHTTCWAQLGLVSTLYVHLKPCLDTLCKWVLGAVLQNAIQIPFKT